MLMPAASGTVGPMTYVDVTELTGFQLRTGIQRVVRELVHHGVNGAVAGSLVPVIALGKRFHALNGAGVSAMDAVTRGQAERKITHDRDVSLSVRWGKRAIAFSPRAYNALQRLYVRRSMRGRSRGLYDLRPIEFAQDDILILLDSFWGGSSTLDAAERAKRAGVKIALVAYDLIPITHPQYCDARLVQKFGGLMQRAAAVSDVVLAISNSCGVAFNDAFPVANVTAFPLGHDVRHVETHQQSSDWPKGLWSGEHPVYLVVGSIEPRKAHEIVVDAFDRLWDGGAPYKLLIVGKVGWNVDALMHRLDVHPQAGKRLFVVHHATDAMLAEAIERAHAAIIASYVEGFGLPLVEALAAGLPVIASDIPVFREIAGDAARYFAPGRSAELADAVVAVADDAAHWHEKARRFLWPDWRQSARIFFGLAARAGAGADTEPDR